MARTRVGALRPLSPSLSLSGRDVSRGRRGRRIRGRAARLGNYVTIVERRVNKGYLPLIEAKNVRIARTHTHVTPFRGGRSRRTAARWRPRVPAILDRFARRRLGWDARISPRRSDRTIAREFSTLPRIRISAIRISANEYVKYCTN